MATLFCLAAAVAYNDDSAKYHDCCENFLPGEGIHADADAYYDCDDRLDVTVHADKSWSYALLSDGDKEIGDECGTDNEICKFGELD